MRFAVIDVTQAECISAVWLEHDRAKDVADELNSELGTDRFVVVPLDNEEACK